jgi:RHS repeat-associated protein
VTRAHADGLLTQVGDLALTRDTTTARVVSTQLPAASPTSHTRHWYNQLGELAGHAVRHGAALEVGRSDCNALPTDTLYCASYERDAGGRIVGMTEVVDDATSTWAYGYEANSGRLATVDLNGELAWSFEYDGNGARIDYQRTADSGEPALDLAEGSSDPSHDIIVDGEDRLLRYGSYDYGYLADGRLAWRRDWSNDTLRCYDYDVFGALRRFREGAISSTATESPCSEIEVQTEVVYDIDPAGRRVGRTQRGYTGGEPGTANVRRWIYADALNPVAQLDERNRITQAYVYGNYAHTPDYLVAFTYADAESTSPSSTTRYQYVYDIRGSVRLVVNASTGVIAQQLDYGPWGEVLDDSAPGFQPFGYAGGEYDATTDLVRFGARDYDAEIGRWTAKDPIGFAGGDTNLYAYVGGDPIGLVDVTGLQACGSPEMCESMCSERIASEPGLADGGGFVACDNRYFCPCVAGFPPSDPHDPPTPLDACPSAAQRLREHEMDHVSDPALYCSDGFGNVPNTREAECPLYRTDNQYWSQELDRFSGDGNFLCASVVFEIIRRNEQYIEENCTAQ